MAAMYTSKFEHAVPEHAIALAATSARILYSVASIF